MSRPKPATLHKMCAKCGDPFDVPDTKVGRDRQYCGKACANAATAQKRADAVRAAGRYKPPVCPCGKEIEPPEGQEHVYAHQKKYCDADCRMKYGKKRQPNPDNYVTFNCQTCTRSVTRYKGYGNGANRFCSNECAAKHTKKVRHYVVRESDMVLDSTWEMLFAGVLGFAKIPVERVEREHAVEWAPGHWYAPDFYLPQQGLYVEIKGHAADDDMDKWTAFRNLGRTLVVMDEDSLDHLRKSNDPIGAIMVGPGPRRSAMVNL